MHKYQLCLSVVAANSYIYMLINIWMPIHLIVKVNDAIGSLL
jgi:hypothetical protein